MNGTPPVPTTRRRAPGKRAVNASRPAESAPAAAALHLDRDHTLAGDEHEVDLSNSVAPVTELDDPVRRDGVVQVRAHRALAKPPPEGTVVSDMLEGIGVPRSHDSRVQHVQLRARPLRQVRLGAVLLQADDKSPVREQIQVVGQRCRVAGVFKLPLELSVGDDLPEYSGARSMSARINDGFATRVNERMSRSMTGDTIAALIYPLQRAASRMWIAAPG